LQQGGPRRTLTFVVSQPEIWWGVWGRTVEHPVGPRSYSGNERNDHKSHYGAQNLNVSQLLFLVWIIVWTTQGRGRWRAAASRPCSFGRPIQDANHSRTGARFSAAGTR